VFSSISSAHSATGSRAVSASHVVASGRRRRAFHRSGIPKTHRLPLHLGAKLMSVLHVAAVMAPQPASLLETQTLGTSQADPAGASEPRRRLRPGPSRNWSLAPPSSRCLGMSLVSLLLPSRSSGLLSPQFSLTPAYCDTVAIKAFALHRLRGSIYTLDGLDTSDALLGRTAITQLLWPRLSISVCQGGSVAIKASDTSIKGFRRAGVATSNVASGLCCCALGPLAPAPHHSVVADQRSSQGFSTNREGGTRQTNCANCARPGARISQCNHISF